jgi:hypothetical protein
MIFSAWRTAHVRLASLTRARTREEIMPIETSVKRMGPTPEHVIAEQKRRAAKAAAEEALTGTAVVPASTASTALALPDTRTAAQQYIDENAPSSIVGRLIKFSKDGVFTTPDDGEPVSEDADFIALCDETLVGWIKFNGKDAPPDRVRGLLLYSDFRMPARDTLGDTDATQWESGLSGAPEDPWKSQACLVLQSVETRELFTFTTTSTTGRRAISNLLRHYDRMQKTNADEVPLVKLKPGGFNHRKVGWVATPVFAVVGRTPRDSAARPDTSVAADMDDFIPF